MTKEESVWGRRKKYCFLTAGFLLMAIAGELFLKPVLFQWSHDRTIGILPVILSVLAEGGGMGLLILLFRRTCKEHGLQWKRELARSVLLYVLCQVAASLGIGLTGALLERTGTFEVQTIRTVLDAEMALAQGLILCIWLYQLSGRMGRKKSLGDKKFLGKSMAGAALLFLFGDWISGCFAGIGQNLTGIVWNVGSSALLTGWIFHIGRRK